MAVWECGCASDVLLSLNHPTQPACGERVAMVSAGVKQRDIKHRSVLNGTHSPVSFGRMTGQLSAGRSGRSGGHSATAGVLVI